MENLMNFYSTFNKLRMQGRHSELLQTINNSQPTNESLINSKLIYYNCLIEVGLTDKAFNYCKQVIHESLSNDEQFFIFLMKRKMFEIVFNPQRNIKFYISYFEEQINSTDKTFFYKANAYECLANVIQKGISFGQLGSLYKQEVISYTKEAIKLYDNSGDKIEFLRCKKKLALLYKEKPFRSFEKAKELLDEIIEASNDDLFAMFHAHCQLIKTEINFIEIHNPEITEEKINSAISNFNLASSLFNQHQYVQGDITVKEKLGILLLEYGYFEGISYLEEVISQYQKYQLFQYESILWRKIADWHQVHGDTEKYLEAENKAMKSNIGLGMELSMFIQDLIEMDVESRNGNLNAAKAIYEKAKKQYGDTPIFRQFNSLRANHLQQVGQQYESLEINKYQVDLLSPLEISPFLADAFNQLASNYTKSDPEETIRLALKALDIQDQLEDNIACLNTVRLIIETLVYQQRLSGKSFQITPAMEAGLEEGFIRLKNECTLKGAKALGELLQTKGQLYFFSSDFDKCREYYNQAEEIFLRYNLKGSLSFLYSQLALSYIGTARELRDIKWFDEARIFLKKAEQLTRQLIYTEQYWRTIYLQAICFYEAGQIEFPLENNERWSAAEFLFEKAYSIINKQRDNLDRSTNQNRQTAIIAFANIYKNICVQAFRMNSSWSHDNKKALLWLERLKAQALVDSLKNKPKSGYFDLINTENKIPFYDNLIQLL